MKRILIAVTVLTIGHLYAQEDIDSTDTGYLNLDPITVSGTLKPVTKSESAVPVEVYSEAFFKSNPTPTLFESVQNINGVRPQVNCNVCNTGDIHINGLEGPYTMILIDGMPIVSGLGTVYGLSGIPQSLIEQLEVIKGPASTLYGSEAVGGLINVITKNPLTAPKFALDASANTWQEFNLDAGGNIRVNDNSSIMVGGNYFHYDNPIDNNKDNFTDITLQKRFSGFAKYNHTNEKGKQLNIAARYVNENRWGGDMRWEKKYRGGEDIYGESIYTSRWEAFGNYDLPTTENIKFLFSANGHDQNSVYGSDVYIADQKILFGELLWDKKIDIHDLLLGVSYRYTFYDDNTPATVSITDSTQTKASITHLPGIFVQDEMKFNPQNKLLLGVRYDHNSIHGNIFTPRLNYKWNSSNKNSILRVGVGNGFRVANIFTEDHAALTGAREVVFEEELKPETSWNGTLNFVQKFYTDNGVHLNFDLTGFYTYFNNKIIGDPEIDNSKIIYDNLDGYAVSKGVSLNTVFTFPFGLNIIAGGTLMDVYSVENKVKKRELFSERFTGTWTVSYDLKKYGLTFDYTGNIYSPMRLPLLTDKNDPRSPESPWWSIQNIQVTKKLRDFEIYGGVKNLLDWTPAKGEPFIIPRTNDPFGEPTADPNDLPFDPAYVYAPNQGIRGFIGLRYKIR